jgi:hypothetical protein
MNIYGLIIGQSHQPEGVLFYQQLTHYAICKAPNGVPDNWESFQTGEHLQLRMEEIEAMNTPQSREAIIDTLTSAAEASGLSVPFESFFYDNRKVVIDWILNGGDSLTKVFEESTEKWMDMRASEESPTPREYALKLLSV